MMRGLAFLICGTWLLLLGGCGTQFVVTVDSIAAASMDNYQTYVLFSGKEGVEANDLHFREHADIVERALTAKGYTKAESSETPDLAIFLNYGISDPIAVQVPIYGRVGGGTTYHSGSIHGSGGFTTYSDTSHSRGRLGVVGSATRSQYYRFVRLDAVDLRHYREIEEMRPVWKTTITSSGRSGDLRKVFPYLVVAGMDYFGTDTGNQVRVRVAEGDRRIKMIVQ